MCCNIKALCSNERIACQRLDAIFAQSKIILIVSGRVFLTLPLSDLCHRISPADYRRRAPLGKQKSVSARHALTRPHQSPSDCSDGRDEFATPDDQMQVAVEPLSRDFTTHSPALLPKCGERSPSQIPNGPPGNHLKATLIQGGRVFEED